MNSTYPGYIVLPMKGVKFHKTKNLAVEEAKKNIKLMHSPDGDPVGIFIVKVVDWMVQE